MNDNNTSIHRYIIIIIAYTQYTYSYIIYSYLSNICIGNTRPYMNIYLAIYCLSDVNDRRKKATYAYIIHTSNQTFGWR